MLEIQRDHKESRDLFLSLGNEKVNPAKLLKGSTENNFEPNSKNIPLSHPQRFPNSFPPHYLVLGCFISIPLLLLTSKAKRVSLSDS